MIRCVSFKLIVPFLLLLTWDPAKASSYCNQGKQSAKDTMPRYAYSLIMKSLTTLTDHESYAIYFEGLAQNVADPKEIFSLPSFEVHRGGYLYVDKEKFETKMGGVQGLSDGKLIVYVNQEEKMMLVDSVRNQPMIEGASLEQLQLEEVHNHQQVFGTEDIGEKNCTYMGKENIQGKVCHKIRADVKGELNTHFLYWIDAQTHQMVLMGEWTGANYNAYWIRRITDTAPKGHIYSVNLPKKKMTEFYGMEVIDNRYLKIEAQKALQQD